MRTYRAFGLVVSSQLPLPELREASGPAEVGVRLKSVDGFRSSIPSGGGLGLHRTPSGTYLTDPRLGRIRVSDGTTIAVDPSPSADPDALRQLVLGPAFRVLLHQRGEFVLHASAVAIDGEAVAFAGPSGAGKSTAAAACYANGHRLIADDIVAIGRDGPDVVVSPGFPRSKLSSATARALDLSDADAADASGGRVYYPADRRFPTDPLSLSRIYVLEVGDEARTEPLSPGEAVYSLAREVFSTRDGGGSDRFERCVDVANRVPVRRLYRPREFGRFDDLVEAVGRDR